METRTYAFEREIVHEYAGGGFTRCGRNSANMNHHTTVVGQDGGYVPPARRVCGDCAKGDER